VASRKQGWIIDTFHALPNPEASEAQSHSQSQAHSSE
jgi:hypothetical protein